MLHLVVQWTWHKEYSSDGTEGGKIASSMGEAICGTIVVQPVWKFGTAEGWSQQANRHRQQAKQAGETAMWRNLCLASALVLPPVSLSVSARCSRLRLGGRKETAAAS